MWGGWVTCVCIFTWLYRLDEGITNPRTGVTGCCERPDVDAGNWFWFLVLLAAIISSYLFTFWIWGHGHPSLIISLHEQNQPHTRSVNFSCSPDNPMYNVYCSKWNALLLLCFLDLFISWGSKELFTVRDKKKERFGYCREGRNNGQSQGLYSQVQASAITSEPILHI